MVLYAGMLFMQLFCGAFRAWFVSYPVLWIAFKIIGQPTGPVYYLAFTAGFGPLALSFATLILPLGGWFWEQQAGGRSPSEREQLIFDDAIRDTPARRPAAAATQALGGPGRTPFLEAVLAHELGHLNSSDARLTAALRRLTTPPRDEVRRGLRTITLIATGGLVVWLTRAPWGAYWRSREHHADEYAAKLGQAKSLARFLELNALDDDRQSRSSGSPTPATHRSSTA
ncbi:MAG: M48 family metalloprotease [Solirubrobacteraceae bacterium]